MTSAQLLHSIANAVRSSVDGNDSYAEVVASSDTRTTSDAYTHLVEAVRSAPAPVILFFDEIDYITPGSPTAAEIWRGDFNVLWRHLRAAYQELTRKGSVLSIFLSGVSSKWFRVESIDGVENSALALVPEEYLSPLPLGASVAMIKDIGPTAGLMFDDETARTIAEACSNIPYWMRKAASYVHRATEIELRPFQPRPDSVAALVDRFIETEGAAVAELAITHLFRVYPELSSVAVACYNVDGMSQSAQLTAILERYGVVKRSRGGNPIISGKMMREGMRHYLDSALRERENVDNAEPGLRIASMNEWAEELAVLGALRNKIERRLRGIALNFIRMDSLHNKQKGSALDRVLKAVDSNTRSRLDVYTADEVIEKFLWTDLVALINREWQLFAPIFADKAQFNQHSVVINQRYDAHAKEIDRASVAEYRRSSQWYEDCLSRM